MENPRVSVQIVTRSRNDGLAVLLSSLLRQTYQNFDVVIGENTPDQKIQQHQLCSFICQRLMYEGHRVVVMQIDPNERDIGKLRNALVKNNPFQDSQIFIRVDDDSFCEPDYIELLVKGFKDDSVGIVGGIVPYIHMPLEGRPIPAKFNEVTKFYDWTDNCVFNYNVPRESYFESGHVRSSYAVRMDVAKKLLFPEYAGASGFSEETEFCIRCWMSGYKVLFNPHARAWHFNLMYGGGRDLFTDKDPKDAQALMEEIKINNLRRMKEGLDKFREEKGIQARGYP